MKIANIDRKIIHIFWTTWGISMKFSGKMWLMIILKVTKNQSITLFLEDTVFEKPLGRFRVNRKKYGDKDEVQYTAPNHGNSGVEKPFFCN